MFAKTMFPFRCCIVLAHQMLYKGLPAVYDDQETSKTATFYRDLIILKSALKVLGMEAWLTQRVLFQKHTTIV